MAGREGKSGEATQAAAGAGAESQIELLGFMLSDEEYALDVLEVKEIVRLQTITTVPRSPAWLKGIVTLRGVIVPIFDLRSRLGLAEIEHGPDTRIVVVYRGRNCRPDRGRHHPVMRLPPKAEPPLDHRGRRGGVPARVVRHRDRLVILLNLPRVIEVAA
jgi:purine-binding chemotaxis protein CheW